jgi:peptidylprolyl isomerase
MTVAGVVVTQLTTVSDVVVFADVHSALAESSGVRGYPGAAFVQSDILSSMQKLLIALIVVGLGVGGYALMSSQNTSDTSDEAKQQADAFMQQLYSETEGAPSLSGPPSVEPRVATPNLVNDNGEKYMKATLHTNQGDITIEFLGNDAPNTVTNFVNLAKGGFYDGTKFHRVIAGFMIQGGDPLSKDETQQARWGTGGPGYKFEDEIHANNKNDSGTISMANAGPDTNGSQFFINVANNNFLDGKHTVFGRVTAGMDVVKKIENTKTGASDRPVSPMVINSITLE